LPPLWISRPPSNARSHKPTPPLIAIGFCLILLAACATATNKPTATASTAAKPKFKIVVATNDAPLPPPWQTPTPPPQFQPPAQTANQPAQPTLATQTISTTPPPRARILPLTARIASVNEKLRFVVVDFTNSRQPTIDEKLGVYRVGEKVAEIKVSGPYRNTTVAADIVAGEVKYGDEVKPE
jgi:hypothetical protein